MVPSYLLSSSYAPYGLLEADKPSLPEVFHIDDLLDFSCDDIGGPIVGGQLQHSGVTSVETSSCVDTSISSGKEVAKKELLSLDDIIPKTDLCVPCDDLADLEWLSSFVDDSLTAVGTPEVFSTYGSFPSAISNSDRTPNMKLSDAYQPYQKSSPVSVLENSPTSSDLTGPDYREVSVPGRARSKRSRTGARIWSSKILPTSSSVNSFESMGGDSYAMSYSPIGSEEDDDDESDDEEEDVNDEDAQSSKRCKVAPATTTPTTHAAGSTQESQNTSKVGRKKNQDNAQAWRCLHCQTQRTPQWRTGPMGPKTLCNACGVRYKSGRLLPEYRPAGSPTYVASKHSHSHKKVLEMRRERELRGQPQGMHPQSIHGATPLREKTNHVQQQQQQKDVKSEYQCYNSKCFSKPMELPRSKPLELPKYNNMSFPRLEFL